MLHQSISFKRLDNYSKRIGSSIGTMTMMTGSPQFDYVVEVEIKIVHEVEVNRKQVARAIK
jgi:hypothetical protein